ncbi:uncharacterized protein Z520_03256 [Fonsecaea multimorphosa CBS 102226]|uniref:Uncharacterized protein n=1 Tax=Fonsecaea multimorphosa CBS 102226 TaxID=1442371 RepID=A0A0D2K433_9EURO|nr:uncharacterized protein Z520_03256 [Fonsecaea multimorphosa CBS 102226]KIY00593.1 hypothetical protein Z520_03256 [Fonsecaea multimorphosa CBS 102226]OAL18985.1 hypothetical protein AYO22_10314 [Fonsecaea multimorphosa]
MEGQRNPELQRVLAALNSFSQQQQQPPPPLQTSSFGSHPYNNQGLYDVNSAANSAIPGLGLLPSTLHERAVSPPPIHRHKESNPTQSQAQSRSSTPRLPETFRSKTSTPNFNVPDASTIVTWPAALKHVSRHLVHNEQVANRIKHLINEQHKHERQWWAGREAIVARQQGRSGTSQQVSAILKSLGAREVAATISPRTSTPSDEQKKADQAELDAYDKKVYAGLLAMAADFDRQLRSLGVPFYAIKHELVILEDGPEKRAGANKGKIDKGELRELQKRMCQTLEDLFGD